MSSVLFINQFYYPDISATSQILQQLAEDLVVRGFRVGVLAGASSYEGGSLRRPAEEEHHGVRIHRVSSSGLGKRNGAARLLDYTSFHASVQARLMTLEKHDVVVTLTTPPLLSVAGLAAKRIRGSLLVQWEQDLYPEIAAAVGSLDPGSATYRICRRISRAVSRSADAIVTVGECMAENLRSRSIPGERVRVIHNWADESRIRPGNGAANPFLERHSLQDSFVVLYSGNFGRAHLFTTPLAAAAELGSDPSVQFLFVGSGARKREIQDTVSARALANVRLLPYQPLEDLGDLLNAASAGLVTQSPESIGLMVPSKLYGLMAAARPVIFVGPDRCEAARVIAAARCGFTVDPSDVRGLASIIRNLRENPDRCRLLGSSGYHWFQANATRARAAEQFDDLLTGLLSRRRRQPRDVGSLYHGDNLKLGASSLLPRRDQSRLL